MKTINLWTDGVSEPGTVSLIVSLEDSDGGTSDTIAVYDDDCFSDAFERAETEARSRGLDLIVETD